MEWLYILFYLLFGLTAVGVELLPQQTLITGICALVIGLVLLFAQIKAASKRE